MFISFCVLAVTVCVLGFKLSDINAKYLGETNSLKLQLKEKEKEIVDLKRKFEEIKNLTTDVEI